MLIHVLNLIHNVSILILDDVLLLLEVSDDLVEVLNLDGLFLNVGFVEVDQAILGRELRHELFLQLPLTLSKCVASLLSQTGHLTL